MGNKIICVLLLCFSGYLSLGQKGDLVFRDDTLHTLKINFYGDLDSANGTAWNDTLFSYYLEKNWGNIDDHVYFPAHVTFDDIIVKDSVGVRMKGIASTQKMLGKEAFKLDFNEFIKGGDLNGLSKLNLQNEYADHTMLANKLSYDLAHWMGIDAPRASFVKVYVNESYYGLYTIVEEINSEFLKLRYPEEGDVFKPEFLTWVENDSVFGVNQAEESQLWYEYIFNADNNDVDPDYDRMLEVYRSILRDVNYSIGDSLNNYFDLEQYIKHFAMDVALVAGDNGFVGAAGANMYYRIDPDTKKIKTIPWDYNLNFELNFYFNRGEDLRRRMSVDSTTQWGFQNRERARVFQHEMHEKGILLHDENRNTLLTHLCHIKNEYYTEEKIKTEIDLFYDLIEDAALEDGNKRVKTGTLLSNTQFLNQRQKLKSYIDTLSTIIQEDLDFYNFSCPAYEPVVDIVTEFTEVSVKVDEVFYYTVGVAPSEATYSSLNWEIEDKDIASTKFYGRLQGKSVGETFLHITNEDGTVLKTIKVVVWDDEVSGLNLSTDLVINEFMAKNDGSLTDENGEYDDWIELYNSTSEEISLIGYQLTDKTDGSVKWEFPDTTIAPESYLIVWADEDGSQGDMHANFKLSSTDGEAIILTNSNFEIIDSITFGPQTVDKSFARIPNGVGDFYEVDHTFNAINVSDVVSINEGFKSNELTIFPNPTNGSLKILGEGTHEIDVYSITGEKVQSFSSSTEIDLSGFPDGIYLLYFDGDKNRATKVVKF